MGKIITDGTDSTYMAKVFKDNILDYLCDFVQRAMDTLTKEELEDVFASTNGYIEMFYFALSIDRLDECLKSAKEIVEKYKKEKCPMD